MNWSQLTLVAWMFLASASGWAGTIQQAQMSGQPQMSTKDGVIAGCGVRIVAISEASSPREIVRLGDVSFNVYNPGIAMVKGGMKTTTLSAVLEQQGAATKTALAQISNVWLRPIGEAITRVKAGKVSASPTTPGSLLYVAGLEEVLALFVAVVEKRPVQIGFQLVKDDTELVLAGTVAMSQDEIAQVSECFTTWSDALTKSR